MVQQSVLSDSSVDMKFYYSLWLLLAAASTATISCSQTAIPWNRTGFSLAQNIYSVRSLLDVAMYVGTGYDLLHGSPDGASLTTGGMDPGLKVAKTVLHQTKQPEGCIEEANCVQFDTSFTDQVFSSDIDFRSYQESHDSSWNIEGEVGFWIFKARGRASKTANELVDEFQKYENIVLNVRNLTNYGEIAYRYHEHLRLSNNFMAAVCQLPSDYEEGPYLSFIKEWGTHVVISAKMGKRVTSRKIITKSEYTKTVMENFTSSDSGSLNLGVFASASMSSSLNSRMIDTVMSATNNSYTSHLIIGSEERPAPITFALRKMDYFLDMRYLRNSAQFIGRCPLLDDNRNQTIRVKQIMAKAIEDYPKLSNINPDELAEVNRTFEPSWPKGQYSLLVPDRFRCPKDWASGYRNLTLYMPRHHAASHAPGGYMENPYGWVGLMSSGYGFCSIWMASFCTKRTERAQNGGPAYWQRGSYCVFRKGGTCPSSFPGVGNMSVSYKVHVTGVITATQPFSHKTSGNTPDGTFTTASTHLNFCCRDDGPTNTPLYLPSDSPFTLLPIGKVCQEVSGMTARLKSLTTSHQSIIVWVPTPNTERVIPTVITFVTFSQPAPYSETSNTIGENTLEQTIYFCEYEKHETT
ncbi:uncharacterized protein LOC129599847 [Paramacrobiotus metropolitanus]|uniref:uncharacterized protein LOC129599847 n=1 Tax=Paramacrobiotus metropolitanus TaxID=2943436 RepID=UPI0024458CD8|nr:uncharacterized protein LOC129599847 [Paramacrobiotus metropolitanus]